MSLKLGGTDLARYPFLNEAGEYLRKTGFILEDISDPDMSNVVDKAIERIESALEGKVNMKLERYEVEISVFLTALIIIKYLASESFLRKFSLFEAMRVESFLVEDLKKQKEPVRKALIAKIFQELLKINVLPHDNNFYKVHISDYVSRTKSFHEKEWKLINRLVSDGFVYLDADETVRLVRNELSILITNRVKSMKIPELPENFKSRIESVRIKYSRYYEYRNTIKVSEYPPCVKHALDVMNKGENLPHSARVMLATYMIALGKKTDEIVYFFQNAPDFNEKITRYQIEHLSGLKGSGIKYTVPSCDKLRSENLCFETAECTGIRNPIQFGRKRNNNDRQFKD